MADISVKILPQPTIMVSVGRPSEVDVGVKDHTIIIKSNDDIYTGSVEVEPSSKPIVLQTRNTLVETDILIKPIPRNYGLVTYDGSRLRIT